MDGVNIPVMEDMVRRCKELNEVRGVEDTFPNVIEAAMALFTSIAMKPKDKLGTKPKSGGVYDNVENESNEQLKRINDINAKLRNVINEHEKLLGQVKESKDAVVDEYKDALGQFRNIIENTESDGAQQFQSILEGVIREVITDTDSDQATRGDESPRSGGPELASSGNDPEQQTDPFAALFQDQQISEVFDYAFAGMDLMRAPDITVTHRTTYNADTMPTHTPIAIEPPVITTIVHPNVVDEVSRAPVPCLTPPPSPIEMAASIPRPPSRPPPATPRRRRTVRPRRREMNL